MKTIKTLTLSLIALAIITTGAYALSTLEPQGTAGSNTHYTLNDIYNKIANFDTYTAPGPDGLINTPGSAIATFKTLTEIYNLLANQPDLTSENIALGATILGVEGTKTNQYPATGQTTSYHPNDDGQDQAGAPLSYTDNGDGTVTDNVTGLMWQQDGSHSEFVDYPEYLNGFTYCADLILADYTDWRVPNVKELISIIDFERNSPRINPVFTNTNFASPGYISSTIESSFTDYAYSVRYGASATVANPEYVDLSNEFYVRCVR